MKSKTIQISDGQRCQVVDHGDIGIAVIYQEREDVSGGRAKWTKGEECLVPRDAWPEVMAVIAKFLASKD